MNMKFLHLLFYGIILSAACATSTQPAQSDGATTPIVVAPHAPTTYYVATDGLDENPGTLAAPWRTIQHAVNNIGAGDTVLVRGGVYAETVTVQVSGTADLWITLQSYAGETAVLDGSSLSNHDGALLTIADQSYLTIDGLELRNQRSSQAQDTPMGIFVTGAAHHITLRHTHIHHIENNGGANGNAHGLAVYGTAVPTAIHDIRIENNELHDLKLGNSEALVLNGNVTDFIISGNTIHDNDNIGIDLIGFEGTAPDPAYDQTRAGIVSGNEVYNIDTLTNPAYGGEQSAAAIYVDGGTDIVIERNRVYQSNFGIEIASEHDGYATSYITVRNNLIYHNHVAGLGMGGYDTERGSTHHCTIVNNTFFENDTNQDFTGELLIQFDTYDNVVQNNIFVANAQSLFMTNGYTQNENNLVDYNLYFAPAGAANSNWEWKTVWYDGFAAYQAATGNDAHSLFADPQFANAAALDLRPLAGSPAIDQGANTDAAGALDFAGNGRIANGIIDLGAYEFNPPSFLLYLALIY
ncbi:MAG: right-handed parallel beta-helix repeat-containing protein [Ardenticatenaceae bacterium]|nr:right-handed parallel beta-helix repeat-containing protein [Ardenticatenaceae bacterium]